MLSHPFPEPLSEAETQVALTFQRDFEKSGIHLDAARRQRFVELSDSILSLGRTFLSATSTPPPIEVPEALLAGMGSQFIEGLPRGGIGRRGNRYVTPGSWAAQMIARYAREGEARRLVYVGSLRKDPERIQVLEQMLTERAELAGVLGKANWAEVALVDKMAKNPANVNGFLCSLADHHRAAAAGDVATLQRLKASSITGIPYPADDTRQLPPLNAWDRDFWSERHLLTLANGSLPPIAPYFSTGTVMLGMSKLFSRLYGITLRPAPLAPGEAWHSSVRRLDVIDEREGTIGVIYCDLFSRNGKPPNAAHYTVRCSRRVDDDDVTGDMVPDLDEVHGPGLDGDTVAGAAGEYQRPIVVLTTDFGAVEVGRPALLGWHDVETLFHEMGHAIHCE
jgi:intermediate peptidase